MAATPITIKLRCTSWPQLQAIYARDLRRSAIFLKSGKPPAIGTRIRIDLSLPSDSLIVLNGTVSQHVPDGGLGGRGPGIDIELDSVPQSAMWLIETALKSAALEQAEEEDAPTRRREAVSLPPSPQENAAMEDGADVVDAEQELVTALAEEHRSLSRLNPFQVLGVPYETNDDAVRAAFGQLTRKYHPDRYARYQSSDARQHASEIFILVRDAYRRLGNEKARAKTLRLLQSRGASAAQAAPRPAAAPRPRSVAQTPARSERPTSPPPPASAVSASALFDEQNAATPSAAAPIEMSSERRGHVPPTYSDADALVESGDLDGALAIYQGAARSHPGDRLARAGVELVGALRALTRRDRLEAAQLFEAVLELDPENERAARELAEMRRIATNERKGLLARLLGKKE